MDTTPGAVPLGTRRTAAEPVILMTTRESVAVWTTEEYGRYLAVSSAYSRWLHPGPVAFDLALPGETTLRAFGISTSAPLGHGQARGQRFERVRSTLRPLKAPWEDQVPEAFTMEHWVYDLDQPPVDRDEPWRWTNGQLEIDLQLPTAITRPAGA